MRCRPISARVDVPRPGNVTYSRAWSGSCPQHARSESTKPPTPSRVYPRQFDVFGVRDFGARKSGLFVLVMLLIAYHPPLWTSMGNSGKTAEKLWNCEECVLNVSAVQPAEAFRTGKTRAFWAIAAGCSLCEHPHVAGAAEPNGVQAAVQAVAGALRNMLRCNKLEVTGVGLPSWPRGFDSHHPLHFDGVPVCASGCQNVTIPFVFRHFRNRRPCSFCDSRCHTLPRNACNLCTPACT
jgi:hypothetical protein